MVVQCEQRGVLCHRIGEGPRRSSNQPTLFSVFQFLRSVGKQHLNELSTKESKLTQNINGEENVEMKAHAFVCTQMSGLNLIKGI